MILRVTFTYRDLSAPDNELGFLSSDFRQYTYTFKDSASVDAYVEKHRQIERNGETLTLLWYDIEYYCFYKQERISLLRNESDKK